MKDHTATKKKCFLCTNVDQSPWDVLSQNLYSAVQCIWSSNICAKEGKEGGKEENTYIGRGHVYIAEYLLLGYKRNRLHWLPWKGTGYRRIGAGGDQSLKKLKCLYAPSLFLITNSKSGYLPYGVQLLHVNFKTLRFFRENNLQRYNKRLGKVCIS